MQLKLSIVITHTHCGRVDRVFGIFALKIPQHMRESLRLRQSTSNRYAGRNQFAGLNRTKSRRFTVYCAGRRFHRQRYIT
jgi:hypothetical protein